MSTGAIVFTVVIVALEFEVINVYNTLVKLKNRFENAFSQIEVQLKRRYDLIPNLVNTAKAYMEHERERLEAVISARNTSMAGIKAAAGQPGGEQAMKTLGDSAQVLAGPRGRMNVYLDDFTGLTANENRMNIV